MDTQEYYRHARSLGAFPAADCLALAKQAAALDEAAQVRRIPPPGTVFYEVAPGAAAPLKLSFCIKVF